jgi:hypothetical protein
MSSFVVRLEGSEDPSPFKHFRLRADAVEHRRSAADNDETARTRADVFEVDTDDTRAVSRQSKGGRQRWFRVARGTLPRRKSRPHASTHLTMTSEK